MRRANASLAWAALDLVCCLLLVVYTLIAPPDAASVDTLGSYAVTMRWPADSYDDIDLYVRGPDGIVYFGSPDVGNLHLEYDDLGYAITGGDGTRGERVVWRGATPGEYTIVCHAYRKDSKTPVEVRVSLWRLRGDDTRIHQQTVTVRNTGDEVTAFRVVLDDEGEAGNYSRLPADLVANRQ